MQFKVNGKTVFAYTASRALDPSKPAIAFVHGAGLDHSWFGLQSRYFGYHGWNVLAFDLPGHGRSEGPPLASIGEMAEWVLGVLNELKVKTVGLAGHSMGSLVALECAARAPERVSRLALIGAAFPMKVSEAFLDAARRNDPAAYDMDTIWGHAPRVPLGANPNPGMWMYGDTQARLSRLAPGVLHAGLKACNDYAAGLDSAAKVKCRTLFVLGGSDMMTPVRTARGLQEKISASKTVIIPGSGHSLMAEAPDAVLDALIEFLS